MDLINKIKSYDSKYIKVRNFIDFCSRAENHQLIQDEFKAIKNVKIFTKNYKYQKYQDSNRYTDIMPNPSNRVQLTVNEYCDTDYINASHINGYKHRKYIATQDPLPNTIYDFWHMILLNDCQCIVMLTDMYSAVYYPEWNNKLSINDIVVFNVRQIDMKQFHKRVLLVSRGNKKLTVVHYHLVTWSKWTNPNIRNDLVEFLRHIRSECETSAPIVVHSPSGIGRTGVYIALDILFDQAKHMHSINIFETVTKLRQERVGMIMSRKQYQFIYEVMDAHLLHSVST